jgi:hypothetical protein
MSAGENAHAAPGQLPTSIIISIIATKARVGVALQTPNYQWMEATEGFAKKLFVDGKEAWIRNEGPSDIYLSWPPYGDGCFGAQGEQQDSFFEITSAYQAGTADRTQNTNRAKS